MTAKPGWTTSVDDTGRRHWHPPHNSLADNLLTPIQYKAAIKALGLSQERAGEWLGIAPRTSQGYALGEYPVPEPVAKLLRLCVRLTLKPEGVK